MVRAPLSCALREPLIIFYDLLTLRGRWRERNRVGVSCPPALETLRRAIQAGSRHNVLDGIWGRSWKGAIQSAQFVGVCRLLDGWLIDGMLCSYFDNSLKFLPRLQKGWTVGAPVTRGKFDRARRPTRGDTNTLKRKGRRRVGQGLSKCKDVSAVPIAF